MDPNKYFSDYHLKNAGRKQKFGYGKRCAIWTGNSYFKSCNLYNSFFYKVGKRPVSRRFHLSRKQIYQEKNQGIRIAPKHNNTLETFLYEIQKHLPVHQSDFTFADTQLRVYGTKINLLLRKKKKDN